ncbi:MAG: DoxX family protein [Fidelibacterota bacterium]|nr:MAG: DoxX family protein [Candidatus Neomarinimicrobiota bacterium]
MEFLNRYTNVVHWLPRLSLASIFIYHGMGKFPAAAMMAEGMGMPIFMIYLLGAMEVVAGVFIIVGAFGREILTRIAGLLISVVMLGAILMVHLKNGWNGVSMEQGIELQLFVFAVAVYFLVRGNSSD